MTEFRRKLWRRRELRYDSDESAVISVSHPAELQPVNGCVIDISQSGFSVRCSQPIGRGAQVRVQIASAIVFGKVWNCRANGPDSFLVAIRTNRVVMLPSGIEKGEQLAKAIDVLLVEDNPGDVRLTELMLEGTGVPYRLTVAMDGEQAIQHLFDATQPKPGLMLLDLNLPRLGGLELLAKIRREPFLQSIVIAVLSTCAPAAEAFLRDELDVRAYLEKPRDYADYEVLGVRVKELLLDVASHSYLNAAIGSTLVARRAGT